MIKITKEQARHLALQHQFHRFSNLKGKAGTLEVIRTLSYIQLDTISVIQRAHHHTLYNRIDDYHPDMLDELLAKDKAIWEYWGHAASYLPREDYPYYRNRMLTFPNNQWERNLWKAHSDISKHVLNRIRKEGPLSSKHFEHTGKKQANNGWGNVKPSKIMLELLMWRGDLIVTARDNWQRVYDLTERVIPHYKEMEIPAEMARAEFMIIRTLQAHGIATESDINKHITLAPRKAVSESLNRLVKADKVRKLHIEEQKDIWYCFADLDLSGIHQDADGRNVRILSPFDNAVILRSRLTHIFDFDYSLECYVTPAKRQFGYWNCPILFNDILVGILDPKADRKSKTLNLNTIFIRKDIWKQKRFQTAFDKELQRFIQFNGCTTYSLGKVVQK